MLTIPVSGVLVALAVPGTARYVFLLYCACCPCCPRYCTLYAGAPALPRRQPFVELGVAATKVQLLALGVPACVYAVAALGDSLERQIVEVAHSFGLQLYV